MKTLALLLLLTQSGCATSVVSWLAWHSDKSRGYAETRREIETILAE